MAVPLYFDHNVPRSITVGLRLRNVDVLTAYEDGTPELKDPALLDRAGELERVLFTMDDDLLVEAVRRQRQGVTFHGVVYAHQLQVPIGRCVQDLEIISEVGNLDDLIRQVLFLPL